MRDVDKGKIKSIFALQNPYNTFCIDVIIAVANRTHAHQKIVCQESVSINSIGVLDTMVAVVDYILMAAWSL